MASYFGSARGERRKLADNLNLVPFIDLFSTIIIFLLSTAVWDQLASIQANLGQGGGTAQTQPKDLVKKVKQNVKITVTDSAIELFDEGKTEKIAKQGDAFNLKPLEEFVGKMRGKYADKNDIVIFATDNARYEDLVLVMDQCLSQQFSELVVTGLSEKL